MFQMCFFIGNLGRDPEMTYTPSGIPMTKFSVAVTNSFTSADGTRQEKTLWINIVAFRKLAEITSQYLTKGRQVLVVGKIQENRPWTDRDGNLRCNTDVIADDVRFLGKKSDYPEGAPVSTATDVVGAMAGAMAGGGEVTEEEIPF